MEPATLRGELTPLPRRIANLPVHPRGFPIPWFVPFLPNGEPEFRVMDARKLVIAIRERRCWVCGEPLGRWLAFVVGPMCGINRTTSEPASHLDCARWSALNCPFLTQRQMKRREDEFTATCPMAGVGLKRNPGVALIWRTRTFRTWRDGRGGVLFTMGDPEGLEFYSHGREATWVEVAHSIETGFPALLELCADDSERAEVVRRRRDFETLARETLTAPRRDVAPA